MRKIPLGVIVQYCDRLLKVEGLDDWPAAHNGLQVENRAGVSHVAAAVDGSLATARMAGEIGADLLLVHHGLFWSAKHPWVGRQFDLVETLVGSGLAVYSAHLPLDIHPVYGNNALLAKALGWRRHEPFFFDRGRNLGVRVRSRIRLEHLVDRLSAALGVEPTVLPGGHPVCRQIGIVTGGAGTEMNRAAAEGVDTFVTGEGPHWTYALAEELGINVIYGGHYATETFGVKALAKHLAEKFAIKWSFADHPTGL
ncbi:MAG: GTP cyclohydrolase 1 type 2 [Verrucomicrobia subdivision 3 bacterium]|nr:GTP cyclohydrolase 1 type 2 [Limisphaerales bacterium]MCS1414537.1 GTP cyclohydrolase 1 type 2 [Limisphaerales bacterium]